MPRLLLLISTFILLISGCAISPKHATLKNAKMAPLLPVRTFVANVDHKGRYRVSPDGKKILWSGVDKLRAAILWRNLDGSGKTQSRRFKKNEPYAFWAADSQHILYTRDNTGREQSHVYAIDSRDGSERDLTPLEGITAWVAKVPNVDSDIVYIAHNGRDNTLFDTYKSNLLTGELTRLIVNRENVSHQLLDDKGFARVRVLRRGKKRQLEVHNGRGWKIIKQYSRFETFYPTQIDQPLKSVYAYSNLNRDRIALVSMDFATGEETVVYQHPNVDIGSVWAAPGSPPLAVSTQDGFPAVHYLNSDLEKLFAPLHELQPSGINLRSLSRDLKVGTVAQYDHAGASEFLIQSGQLELLSETAGRKNAEHWSAPQPFSIAARDGLQLHGYVTRPKHVEGPTPTVLRVHGGPWARDYWEPSDQTQFLANRWNGLLPLI